MDIGILLGVLGIVIGYFISKYFYDKSINKQLTPFIDITSSIFTDLDEEVKKVLNIEFKGRKVNNLTEVQFLIANTGDRAIRDIIKPLEITLPPQISLIDVALLYVYPKGRNVILEKNENKIIMNFDLLNKKEFFVMKILFDGDVENLDFEFRITVDDLPPILHGEPLPYNLIETDKPKRESVFVEYIPQLLGGLLLLMSGISVGFLAYKSTIKIPSLSFESLSSFFNGVDEWLFNFELNALMISYILSFILIVLGILLLIFGSIEAIPFFRKKRFVLPDEVFQSKSLLLKD